MSVVPLTLAVSLCLVFTFVLFFLREHSRRRFSSAESEALLPLAEETPRPAEVSARPERSEHVHGPGHACQGNGSCHSCRKRAARQVAGGTLAAAEHRD